MRSNSLKRLKKIPHPQLAMIYHPLLVEMLRRCVGELNGEPSGNSPRAEAEQLLKEIKASTPGK